ncbi:MAG: hypothetical protein IJW82_06195 [Clostridia bacterium]|nr:hypothetical protein [Clostridia bacterium]
MKMPLKSRLTICIIFAIIALLLPRAFTKVSETKATAIVTALGIDAVDDEIEISAQIIIPKSQAGTTENLMAISSKNTDVAKALEDLSAYIGKNVGIEHCNSLILGESISKQGVNDVLDFFFRGNKIGHNTLLIYFDGKAKDLIEATAPIDNSFSLSIDQLTRFSGEYFSALEITLEKFYTQTYSNNNISTIGGLKFEEANYGLSVKSQNSSSGGGSGTQSSNSTSGQSSSQSGTQSSSKSSESSKGSQSSQESKPKFLVNNSESAIFKDGKMVKLLNKEETIALNWFLPESKKTTLRIDNINDYLYQGASAIFTISNKMVKTSTDFIGNKPILNVDIYIDLKIENIIGGNRDNFKDINKDMFTPMLKSRIIGEIQNQTNSIFNIVKNEKLDLIRAYDTFEKFNYHTLKDYLNEFTINDFYENLIPNIKIHLTEKI